ncbi:MAG: hypothetical protein ACOYON_03500 [Fimbriimonas sp.]
MESAAPKHLKLGDELNGTVLRPIGGRRFLLQCADAPTGWEVELQTRRPEAIEIGRHTTFWVAKVNPLQGKVLVTDGDYGRLPISAAMAQRYREGLLSLLGRAELTAESLADARGMVARIVTRDQADWLTVWRLLGEPISAVVQEMNQALAAIRLARKEKPEELEALLLKFREKYGEVIETALYRLGRSSYVAI